MEIGSTSLLGAGSRCCTRILILPFVLLCGPILCCCLALGAGGFFIDTPRWDVRPLPGMDEIPPVLTVPAIPIVPTQTPVPGSLLDPDSPPLFGSVALESGFSPDPYRTDVEAGGSVDTAGDSPACGYTSFHPAFVLDWQEGDIPESFLRIFFTPDDDTGTTLLVHTPRGDWLCEQDSVLDLPSAPSGEYAIWVGLREDAAPVEGSLFITGSTDVSP
jgi:hypothetical protein